MSACVCPHGTTRVPLNGFSRNLIFQYFSNVILNCRSTVTRVARTGLDVTFVSKLLVLDGNKAAFCGEITYHIYKCTSRAELTVS